MMSYAYNRKRDPVVLKLSLLVIFHCVIAKNRLASCVTVLIHDVEFRISEDCHFLCVLLSPHFVVVHDIVSHVSWQMTDLVFDEFDKCHWPFDHGHSLASFVFLMDVFGQFSPDGSLAAVASGNGRCFCSLFCWQSRTDNSMSIQYCLCNNDVTEIADDFVIIVRTRTCIATSILVVDRMYFDVKSHDVSKWLVR